MSTVVRPPTTRASGGRSLLLLGVLLALAAGIVVLFVVSRYTNSPSQQVTVVVAAQDLKPGTILTTGTSDSNHVPISAAFTSKSVNSGFLPPNAYLFSSQEALNTDLNNLVVTQTIYEGDFLRMNDPRLVKAGSAAGSLFLVHPDLVPPGDVIVEIQLSNSAPGVFVDGDHVDILVTECNLQHSTDPGGCVTQDTLKNVLVYTVRGDYIFFVLGPEQALQLKYLAETGKITLAVRGANDSTRVTTAAVNAGTIVQDFQF